MISINSDCILDALEHEIIMSDIDHQIALFKISAEKQAARNFCKMLCEQARRSLETYRIDQNPVHIDAAEQSIRELSYKLDALCT